jgi:hypothetical protein
MSKVIVALTGEFPFPLSSILHPESRMPLFAVKLPVCPFSRPPKSFLQFIHLIEFFIFSADKGLKKVFLQRARPGPAKNIFLDIPRILKVFFKGWLGMDLA